jgi:uncharacterized membrane protein
MQVELGGEMTFLILGLVLFLGVHSTRILAPAWRTRTIARIGEGPWKGLYSLVSLVGFALLVWGYGQARQQMPLWDPPGWTRHSAALLMLPVFPMFVAAYVPRNGIKARLKHPQVLSVKLWAVAHLVANGNLADVVLFGAFLGWAVVDFSAARKRDRETGVTVDSRAGVQAAGPHPNPPPEGEGTKRGTVVCMVVGLVVYVVFAFWLHGLLIGVRPFG